MTGSYLFNNKSYNNGLMTDLGLFAHGFFSAFVPSFVLPLHASSLPFPPHPAAEPELARAVAHWAAPFVGSVWMTPQEVGAALGDAARSLLGDREMSSAIGQEIVVHHRLTIALTAALSGAALGGSGLFTQTLFRNPLADPSLLGINAGAALGAALAMMVVGSVSVLTGFTLTVLSALLGALVVLSVLLSVSRRLASATAVLLVGVMLSFMVSSVLAILAHRASADGLRHYQLWLLGDCTSVSWSQLPLFALAIFLLLLLTIRQLRVLDAWLLGDVYAQSLGISVDRERFRLLGVVGLLSAVVTALCGPIAFVGLAAPHAARLVSHQGAHQRLLPLTLLMGSALLLFCQLVARLPLWGEAQLPLNAVTPLVGAPIMVLLLLQHRPR